MKKILLSATAIVVAGAFALTGCSSERGGTPTSGRSHSSLMPISEAGRWPSATRRFWP